MDNVEIGEESWWYSVMGCLVEGIEALVKEVSEEIDA